MKYDHSFIEKKWQQEWEKTGVYKDYSKSESSYVLDMFPYPSGVGLHVGHPKGYIATDVFARMKLLQGKSVLHPMGWDAFGLPAENYAIANKVHPAKAVEQNIEVFKQQLQKIGFTYDWDREINTTDPAYYRWTQWIFLKLFERGLAYEADEPINWCPSCKTGLANEDLEDGKCERCGSVIEQKKMRQWKLRMTAYADRLLEDLDKEKLDWEESIKIQQRNWIGRSEGLEEMWQVEGMDLKLKTFTTWPHTTWGATFMVIAPEHPLIAELVQGTEYADGAQKFIQEVVADKIKDPRNVEKIKKGYFLGRYVINHLNGRKMPLYIANFAIYNYGTGIVKCTPAHDQRDFEFAKLYKLDIVPVIVPDSGTPLDPLNMTEAYTGEGTMVNAKQFDGMPTLSARKAIGDFTAQKGEGRWTVNYKMRDWVFSRQRYWGEPIPMIRCEACKIKKYQYVFIHGFCGSSQEVYQAWLKAELERQGNTVVALDLPHADQPNITEQVKYLLQNITFTSDTILVGHSLGGVVIMKLLEQLKSPVRRSVFVDPVVTPNFNDHARPAVSASNDWKFDYGRIKANAGEVIILSDASHVIIRAEDIDFLRQKLGASQTITVVPQDTHFDSPQEPEILCAINSIGVFALPEDQLPLKLPDVERYEPTGTGESPLAGIPEWVNVPCPQCGGPARRETNTMPQWAGSSWYYLRYLDPKNQTALVNLAQEKKWLPIDLYVGGAEHATRHLLYARFWHKFLYDIGAVSTIEPFKRLVNVGMILAEDGRKMSKRWNNVINPDDVIAEFGADSLRLYEMFMGPFTQTIAWSTDGVRGMRRFLEKVWQLSDRVLASDAPEDQGSTPAATSLLHKTIKKVTDDIEGFRFNTAVSSMMVYVNELNTLEHISEFLFQELLILLSPFAPHITEELWEKLGHKNSIFTAGWPEYNADLAKDDEVEFVVQVNGKVRDRFTLPVGLSQEEAEKLAFDREAVKKWVEGKDLKKKVFVQDKILNIVV